MQSYVTAGEFTVTERILGALKENILFYLIVVIVVAVVGVWVIITRGFGVYSLIFI